MSLIDPSILIATAASAKVIFLIDELDVCEWKVTGLSFQLALPLAVYVHFGYFYCVTHLQLQRSLVVCIGHTCLLYFGKCGKFALKCHRERKYFIRRECADIMARISVKIKLIFLTLRLDFFSALSICCTAVMLPLTPPPPPPPSDPGRSHVPELFSSQYWMNQ